MIEYQVLSAEYRRIHIAASRWHGEVEAPVQIYIKNHLKDGGIYRIMSDTSRPHIIILTAPEQKYITMFLLTV